MSLLKKGYVATQLKASCLKWSMCKFTRNWASMNLSPVRLLWPFITVLDESTIWMWGWHRTFQMAIQYSVTLTVQTRPLGCPSTQTQVRPLLCCRCTKPSLLKHSSHAPMTPGSLIQPETLQGEAELVCRPKIHNLPHLFTDFQHRRQLNLISDCISGSSVNRK